MDNLSMIAAIGKNRELGKDNQLIWRFKEDMKFFKEQTIGKPIVMGRKTLESLPKLLPERKHIVLTKQKIELPEEIIVIHNKEDLLAYIDKLKEEVMVIGGASIYSQLLAYSEKLILTEIEAEDKTADAYFPSFLKEEWNRTILSEEEENGISYKHLVYTRKS